MIAYCSYYGRLQGKLEGNPLSLFCIEDELSKLIDKYEHKLIKDQAALIEKLKNSFSEEIYYFKQKNKEMEKRLIKLESKKTEEGKENEKDEKTENKKRIRIKKEI